MTQGLSTTHGAPRADALSPDTLAPLPRIEGVLEGFVANLPPPDALRDAVAYALLGGGKRFRPLLAWHCAVAAGRAAGAEDPHALGEASLHAGAAVELVHAFSLVHDDLPAMDDDDLRRGKPTLHIHAGEAMAILAGDAMLAFAFGLLGEGRTERVREAGPGLTCALGRELLAGTAAMIGGQVWDTLGGLPADLDARARLELIHRHKTGALIRAAARMGAICGAVEAGHPCEEGSPILAAIGEYADAIGLIFQITDDLLDVEQSSEAAGKRTGKDAEAGKLTYPVVLGVEGSRAAVAEQTDRALGALQASGLESQALAEICRFLSFRTR